MIAGTELMTAANDLLGQVVLVIAHNAAFDRPFSRETAS
jgi:hypothetical protein